MGSFLKYARQRIFSVADAPGVALGRRIAPGRMFGDLQLKACRYGPMLFSGPIIGKCFELYGEYSEAEVALMRNFVAPGDTVIDIGANIGDLSVPLAQMAGPAGTLLAFESHIEIFHVLCANLALNGLKNARALNAYVRQPRQDGAPLAAPDSPYLSARWTPPDIAIDDLGLERCSLLKVDVDGVEEDILRSGAQLLRRARPVLYVENDVRENSPGLLRYMDGLGYDLYWHAAPVFLPDNFFGNADNYWTPQNIVSTMVLGIPAESGIGIGNLPRVRDFDQWWDFKADWVNDQLAPGFTVRVQRAAGAAGGAGAAG